MPADEKAVYRVGPNVHTTKEVRARAAALGIALLQQGEGVSPGGCTYRSMVLVPETIEARGLPVAPRARAELCASETGRIEIVVTVWPEQENTKPAEEAPGYPEACGTVSECVQVVAVDPDGGRWIVGVDRTRRAPFVLQVMGNGGYRDATQEDGPWHMRLNPGDDVLWQAAFILEEGFRARRIEYCRPVNVCLAGEIEDTPDNEESAEHEWFWMAGASIGRWHPQAGTRGSVGLRYVYRTPERELGFVVAPVEPLPPTRLPLLWPRRAGNTRCGSGRGRRSGRREWSRATNESRGGSARESPSCPMRESRSRA